MTHPEPSSFISRFCKLNLKRRELLRRSSSVNFVAFMAPSSPAYIL